MSCETDKSLPIQTVVVVGGGFQWGQCVRDTPLVVQHQGSEETAVFSHCYRPGGFVSVVVFTRFV